MVVPVLVFGAANKEYTKAILLDITVGEGTVGVPAGQGTLIVQHKVFRLSVKFDDLVYTAETRSKEVRQLVVGDPVEARLDEKTFTSSCRMVRRSKRRFLPRHVRPRILERVLKVPSGNDRVLNRKHSHGFFVASCKSGFDLRVHTRIGFIFADRV
jgi:hypothetical protein